ncbi:MAG: macro domain-containing protein [Acidobacteria bacterium]|nr:macro domain-containing protein [Acidobacteriota bacterium]
MASIDRIKIKLGDITEFEGEAIVNAANTDLILGGGVAGAIKKKGGFSIQEECNKIGKIALGEAALTKAGNLKAKFVIHAAAMGFDEKCTEESLKSAVLNSLKVCKEEKIKSVAFPAIGMGIAGFPMDKGSEILLETILSFLLENNFPEEVSIILYDKKSFDIFKNKFDKILLGFQ